MVKKKHKFDMEMFAYQFISTIAWLGILGRILFGFPTLEGDALITILILAIGFSILSKIQELKQTTKESKR